MRTSRIYVGFFKASVLFVFWLTKHTVDSTPTVVTAEYGGSVEVPCQYDLKFRDNTKYWCKGIVYELCKIVVRGGQASDRASISDDKEAGVFTVTMTSLRKSDDDVYWCVISSPGRNTHTRVRLVISQTGITPTDTTPTNSSLIQGRGEVSWWETLRWIIFIFMLCCLLSTHIIVWRMKAAQKPQQPKQSQYENIYE
ncbi:CMRF35-like molecule 7 [Scomber japonicus]|uniref:CMRF35-like molecule 7 n=1 Tax=Scomber japonicus TaxID=13676 RepID=UPI0023062618|nr:CMRF35-like molecule 7 [Scomber japonicus]